MTLNVINVPFKVPRMRKYVCKMTYFLQYISWSDSMMPKTLRCKSKHTDVKKYGGQY